MVCCSKRRALLRLMNKKGESLASEDWRLPVPVPIAAFLSNRSPGWSSTRLSHRPASSPQSWTPTVLPQIFVWQAEFSLGRSGRGCRGSEMESFLLRWRRISCFPVRSISGRMRQSFASRFWVSTAPAALTITHWRSYSRPEWLTGQRRGLNEPHDLTGYTWMPVKVVLVAVSSLLVSGEPDPTNEMIQLFLFF